MNNTIVKGNVDIYQYPDVDYEEDLYVTLGDLHGNAIKLIFFLMKEKIAKLSKEDYVRLIEIYKTDVNKLTKEDLNTFASIIRNRMIIVNKNINIRLLGDDCADRGMGDHYTLWILDKLHQEHVPFEIIFSNHASDFITYIELLKEEEEIDFEEADFAIGSLELMQSMINTNTLIEKGLIPKNEIIDLFNRVYKPSLKVFSYTLNHERKEISFYSHAPVDLDYLANVANEFELPSKIENRKEVAETIELINLKFQKELSNNRNRYITCAGTALFDALWNNDLHELKRAPQLKSGESITFTHGHRIAATTKEHICSLDTGLGITVESGVGEYMVTHTIGSSLNTKIKDDTLEPSSEDHENYSSMRCM